MTTKVQTVFNKGRLFEDDNLATAKAELLELRDILDSTPVYDKLEIVASKDWQVESKGIRFSWADSGTTLVQVASDGKELILHIITDMPLATKILELIKRSTS
jgi:hypothetical protein